jgi:hypothetical protein
MHHDLCFSEKMKDKLLVLTFTAMLAGCSNGHLEKYTSNEVHTDSQVIGIPVLFGGHGSSVPFTEDLSLTAAHVAEVDYSKVVAYHPSCDLAIVEKDNKGKKLAKIGKVYQGGKVYTIGKGLPFPTHELIGSGTYIRDLKFANNQYYKDCPASLVSAAVQVGMSGGGAYNEQMELVGILSSMATRITVLETGEEIPDSSIIVPILYAEEWIKKVVKEYEMQNKLN